MNRVFRSVLLAVAALLLATEPASAQRFPRAGGRIRQARVRNQIDRLSKMKPEERKRFLETLPPDRRETMERRLERYGRLTPEEREQLERSYESFEAMTPERREEMRRLFSRFNGVPEERRSVLRREVSSMRSMTADERKARLESDEVRDKYTSEERQLLSDLAKVLPNKDSPDNE